MTNTILQWQSAGITHVGKVRTINEDAILVEPESGLWAVADGMGGHDAGDLASQAVIASLQRLTRGPFAGTAVANLECALRRSNDALVDLAQARGKELIGSTLACLTAWNHFGIVSWVGDSRVYLARDGVLAQVTTDHSEVQRLVQMGLLDADEAEHHPRANVITRAIGSDEPLVVDHQMIESLPGDLYLLCSDGLSKETEDRELEACCNTAQEPEAVCRDLLALCLARECRDNVSVVCVKRARNVD